MSECSFDHLTFLEPFDRDLQNVRLSVLIQSPFVSDFGISRLEERLKDLADREIPVCMFVQQPKGWCDPLVINTNQQLLELEAFKRRVERLKALKVHVNIRQFIHEKVIVLDFGILYDGGMNVMSYNPERTSERMTRTENAYKSLCAIAMHSLDSCVFCIDRVDVDHSPALRLEKHSVGVSIATLRQRNGISQQELAMRIGKSRSGLGKIEAGKNLPMLGTILEICETLDSALVAVPKYTVPYVLEITRLLPKPTTSAKPEQSLDLSLSAPRQVSVMPGAAIQTATRAPIQT